MNKNQIAEILHNAAMEGKAVPQMMEKENFTLDDAYLIQSLSIDKRIAQGERIAGYKLGFTSKEKMIQMNVHDMIWGILTNQMNIEEGGKADFSKYIHPRVEPEIALLIGKNIKKPLNLLDCFQYVEAVAPALEVIDSRYKDFKFSLKDVIADNCSSTGYVLGKWHSKNTEIRNLGTVLKINNQIVQMGSSNAVLGDPWRALPAISRLAHQYEKELPAGSIILVGAITQAVAFNSNDVIEGEFQGLGKVGFFVS